MTTKTPQTANTDHVVEPTTVTPQQFSYMKLQCTAGFTMTGLLGAAALALALAALLSGKKQPEEIAQVAVQGALIPLLLAMAFLMQTVEHHAQRRTRRLVVVGIYTNASFMFVSGVFSIVSGVMTVYGATEMKSAGVKLGNTAVLVLGVLCGVALSYGIRELVQALDKDLEDPVARSDRSGEGHGGVGQEGEDVGLFDLDNTKGAATRG